MNKLFRILSCLLIMSLLVTMMAVPVFADETTPNGQITLKGPNSEDLTNKTFEIYRIFDATVSNDAIAYQWIKNGDNDYYFYDLFFGPEIKVGDETIAPLIGAGPTTGKADIGQVTAWIEERYGDTETGGAAWVAEFGHNVYKYIQYKESLEGEENKFDAVKTTTNDESVAKGTKEIKFTGLDYGYYLVYETTAFAETDNSQVRSAVLLTTIDDEVEATLKMVTTNIKKMVKRDTIYFEGLSAAFGTKVQFYIEASIPNFQYYQVVPKLQIWDHPDEGFSLPPVPSEKIKNEYTVTIGTTALKYGTDYTIFEDNETGDYVFDFINYDLLKEHANQRIIIEYAATLNDKANIGGHDNKDPEKTEDDTDAADVNTARLVYTVDPYDRDETNYIEDSARVYSFQLDLYKQSSHTKAPLEGAEFKLKKNTAGTGTTWAIVDATGRINGWVEDEAQASLFKTKLDTEGEKSVAKVSFIGLGRGAYELKEVTPPAGYNALPSNILFEIGGETDEGSGVLTDLWIKSTNPSASGLSASVKTGVLTMTVENTTGVELPETGGMGTALFTIGGLLLMAVAAVLLLTRRKTEN